MGVQERFVFFLISYLFAAASATMFPSSSVLHAIFSGCMVNDVVVFQKGL